MNRRWTIVATCLLLAAPLSTSARTWHIQNDGSGDAATIQAGIDAAAPGDTVLAYPGTYYEGINFKGKDLAVLGQAGPLMTVLDGSKIGSHIVTFAGTETRAALLEGFTIRLSRVVAVDCLGASPTIRRNQIVDNLESGQWGGGMVATGSPLIEDNTFEANESGGNVGCMYVSGQSPVIRNNIFRNNRSGKDGGAMLIFNIDGECLVEGNEFLLNVAGDHGGAIEIWNDIGTIIIQNNLFVENVAKGNDGAEDSGTGGCLSIRGAQNVMVWNNTFVANSATNWANCTGGTILLDDATNCAIVRNIIAGSEDCAIACYGAFTGELRDNLFWHNTPQDFSAACDPGLAGPNLYADPLFCGPEAGDYRVSRQSPALTGSFVIGAFPQAACGAPEEFIPVTWGVLKTRFGAE